MQPFEKLGAFYLGRLFDADRQLVTDELLLYDAKDLTTHAVCVGMTGSGVARATPRSSLVRDGRSECPRHASGRGWTLGFLSGLDRPRRHELPQSGRKMGTLSISGRPGSLDRPRRSGNGVCPHFSGTLNLRS